MAIQGADFYGHGDVCDRHTERRQRSRSANESLEKPVFYDLLGDVNGCRILDLGCGDGISAIELLAKGCDHYLGVDSSKKMVETAKERLAGTTAEVRHSKIEEWEFTPDSFDLTISRLALHYVPDFDLVCSGVFRTLRPRGRFVFSVVHPVVSSCDRSRQQGTSGGRQDWIVDDYFVAGPREVVFLDEKVTQFHRTIEEMFGSVTTAGFSVEKLRESRPRPENFEDKELYERRLRIPLMLFFSCGKN